MWFTYYALNVFAPALSLAFQALPSPFSGKGGEAPSNYLLHFPNHGKMSVMKYNPAMELTKEQITELGKDLGIKNWKQYDDDW